MFIAMAGQNLFESVLVLYGGGAYPWHIREGTHCFDPANNRTVASTNCSITSYVGDPLIGPIVELGRDVGNVVVGGVVYRGSNLSAVEQGSYLFGTWSDSFAVGNGTLLVATPPAGLDTAMWPEDAASLTPEENAMWTTSELAVANNADGRINAFVRGLYETADREVLVLINQNPGPGVDPQNSGEVWMMVPSNTTGLVPIGNTTAGPTPTETVTPTMTDTTTPTPTATTGLNSTVDLAAQNLAFSQSTITVQAGALVTMNFNNMDAGVPHNFALYTDASAATPIFRGELVTGPTTTTYTFTAPSTPGTYFFRCDVHPTTMTGTFVVT
jgi:plastocyanin